MDRRLIAALPLLLLIACKNEPKEKPLKETPPPVAVSQQAVAAGKKRFAVATEGMVSVVIDAPLEKFKGDTKKLSGVLDIDVGNLKGSSGEIIADLDGFTTHTFADADQNETQTEHVHNWFEIGEKVEAAKRDDYKMARFTIESIDEASVPSVAAAKEEGGVRKVHLKATGQLRVHGRSSKKIVEVDVSFMGPPDAPTAITFKTTQPMVASLSEHDVKPRDLTGQFLAGALEKVGKKIDDKAQIDVEGKAAPKG
ncbi:MAG: YceI family protein [Polyangiales bacterium]